MRCNYCPADAVKLIVHRDSRCLAHLAKTGDGFCSHAPAEVKEDAQRRLMVKGGIEVAYIYTKILILSKLAFEHSRHLPPFRQVPTPYESP